MPLKVKYGVYAGRFQIPTIAHLENIEYAATQVNHLFVAIGTSYGPRDDANPFLGAERREMLQNALINRGKVNILSITFLMLDDYEDDNDWAEALRTIIHSQARYDEVYLVGMSKDASSYYLKMFPHWQSIECPKRYYAFADETTLDGKLVSATDIRRAWIAGEQPHRVVFCSIDQTTSKYINEFRYNNPEIMKMLKSEQEFYDKHKQQLADIKAVYPYPIQYITVDAAMFYEDHVALIRRKHSPGLGLWALAGGYLNPDERIIDGIKREAVEETSHVIDVDPKAVFVQDNHRRSRRGRIVTHVGVFDMDDNPLMPEMEAADDADRAEWFPVSVVLQDMKHQMFEDHFALVQKAYRLYKGK